MDLRPEQEQIKLLAIEKLRLYKIVYLAMEMRTGKTATALMTASDYGAKSVLFFTRKKAIPSIEYDYLHFAPGFNFKVLNYEKLFGFLRPNANPKKPAVFDIVSFEAAYLKADMVVADEAHSLGQYPIKANKIEILQKICNGLPIIYLSGTPSPESYSQLYHQFYISSFSPFGDYKSFYKFAHAGFVTPAKKYYFNRAINDYSQAKKELIEEKIKHLFITMTQKEAGFNQEVTDEVLTVQMKPSTYALAAKIIKDRVYTGKDGSVILADTEVKLQAKLHQIFSGTVKPEPEQGQKYGVSIVFDYSKPRFIKAKFEGQKIAIFYVFQAEQAAIWATFGYENCTDSVEEFKQKDKTFVGQVVACREGVDLSAADALVMMNIGFAALNYIQARARLQSKDRVKPCIVYWVFSEGGIEAKVFERVKNKLDYTLSYFRKDFLNNAAQN